MYLTKAHGSLAGCQLMKAKNKSVVCMSDHFEVRTAVALGAWLVQEEEVALYFYGRAQNWVAIKSSLATLQRPWLLS